MKSKKLGVNGVLPPDCRVDTSYVEEDDEAPPRSRKLRASSARYGGDLEDLAETLSRQGINIGDDAVLGLF